MDKKQLEDITVPSVVESFNKIQKQIDPLHQIRSSSKILEMMEQNARISSASNIGEIARKALQKAALDSNKFENQSTIARYADLGFRDTLALQNTFLKARKELSAYSDTLSMKERVIQSIGGASVYEDMMASVNRVRKSIEPLRDTFNATHSSFEASEISRLVKDIQLQKSITNSVLSDYAGVFEQLESLRNLESFKAISRLENFPDDKVWTQSYDEAPEIKEDSLVEARNIDAKIRNEISSVDDFNDLSRETQNSLKEFLSEYYKYFIIEVVVSLCLLQESLDKDLDLSSKSFVFVGNVKESVFFIGNYWNQNKAEIIRGLITNAISSTLIWFLFTR